jgi:fructan beta-fructosidase
MKKWAIAFIVVFFFCGLSWAGDKVPESMEMVFVKKYLNMPVKHRARKRTMDILIDGKIVRQFVIELAEGEPDYWVFLDISEFRGKKATLKLSAAASKSKVLEKIYQDDAIREAETFYKEKNRQQFHFSSRRGWNNDSNGLVYYKGEYHLYYQHNPYGWNWGNMHWAHAVSTDLIHWKELPIAIYPYRFGDWVFSGSAVVDKDNTAGFKTGAEDVIVAAYTSTGRGEAIAYSNDRGRTFTDYAGNPVVKHSGRDPKVIWYEPGEHWVMALYSDIDKKRTIAFYTSPDLKDWTYQSNVPGFYECPEIFELPVNGDKAKAKWVIYGADGSYMIGSFDGKTFTPESDKIRYHYGNCFYASQTYNNIPEQDGRRIQIAWGRIATPGMPFNQCMLFPVELTLHTTEEGIRMFAEPVREISTLYKKKHSWQGKTIKPGENLLEDIKGELFHIQAEFSLADAEEFGFVIRGLPLTYNAKENLIACKDKKARLKPEDGKIRLEILVDKNSVEIFGNNGSMYMPIGQILPEDNKSIELFTKGGKTQVEDIEVYELNSAWK